MLAIQINLMFILFFCQSKIILIMKPSSRQRGKYEQILKPDEDSPQVEEWAIINKYKAMEFQKMKERQFLIDREKKLKFKQQLDIQKNLKSNNSIVQKEQDRRYYQKLADEANMLNQKEENARIQKIHLRKQIQSQNHYHSDVMKDSRHKNLDNGYNLEIGLKSELQHKKNEDYLKRNMMDTLDKQVEAKNHQKMYTKIKNLEVDEQNLQYQKDLLNRNAEKKHFGQNQKVYHLYQNLDQDKRQKEKQLMRRFVEEAEMRKMQEEVERSKRQELRHQHEKIDVLQTLEHQVKLTHQKKAQQRHVNPEDLNYSFISDVFRPKKEFYDKNKYYEDLRKQAEEQKMKKKKANYMSELEYKINMNQLSKAVAGKYSQENYLDRSLGAIGESEAYRVDKIDNLNNIPDRNSQAVRHRMQNIKNHSFASPPIQKKNQHNF